MWDNLNKAYPRILWHKTYVMYCREMLSKILDKSQATGKGALSRNSTSGKSLENHLVIDPRLIDLDSTSAITSARLSPFP